MIYLVGLDIYPHLHFVLGCTMASYWRFPLLVSLVLSLSTNAQLVGPVGPTTPLVGKTRGCNILDYGAKADNHTNVAPAIKAALMSASAHILGAASSYQMETSLPPKISCWPMPPTGPSS